MRYTQTEPATHPFFTSQRFEWCAVLSGIFVAPFLVLSIPVVIATEKPKPTVIAVLIVGAGASWVVGAVAILLLTWFRHLFGETDPAVERREELADTPPQTPAAPRTGQPRAAELTGGACVLTGVALFVVGRSMHGGLVVASVVLTTLGLVIFFAGDNHRRSR